MRPSISHHYISWKHWDRVHCSSQSFVDDIVHSYHVWQYPIYMLTDFHIKEVVITELNNEVLPSFPYFSTFLTILEAVESPSIWASRSDEQNSISSMSHIHFLRRLPCHSTSWSSASTKSRNSLLHFSPLQIMKYLKAVGVFQDSQT